MSRLCEWSTANSTELFSLSVCLNYLKANLLYVITLALLDSAEKLFFTAGGGLPSLHVSSDELLTLSQFAALKC